MSTGSATAVYTGFWRNYDADAISGLGLTLTIPQIWGTVLIAFVALFVNATMVNLWSIACFIIHQYRSTPSHSCGLYHQQQAVLCNAPTTASTVVILLRLAWTWRGKISTAIRSSLPLVSTAVFYLVLMSAAGLFTSRALLRGDQVLIASSNCGFPVDVTTNATSSATDTAVLKWIQLNYVQAREYVRNCYTPDGVFNRQSCKIYVEPNLPLKTNTNASCPFSSDICAQSTALEMDTGYIYSNAHLGINTPKEDQLRYRSVFKCAPILAEEKYSTSWALPDFELWPKSINTHVPGNKYKLYNLGPSVIANFTWMVSNYSMLNTDAVGRGYELRTATSYADFHDDLTVSDFSAIDDLIVTNADTAVISLLNGVVYRNATQDPWFRASSSIDKTGLERPDAENGLYYADKVLSAIACTQQYQYCTEKNCTSLLGAGQSDQIGAWVATLNPKQAAVFELLGQLLGTSISDIITTLGSRLLQANDIVVSTYGLHTSPTLPSTQWQTEMINILNIGLASTQRAIADYANSPEFYIPIPESEKPFGPSNYTVQPEGELKSLCSAVRVTDLRFNNFSVIGLILILGFGLVIISINLLLLPGAAFSLKKKYGMREYPQQEWQEGRMFMMQRSFLLEQGVGPWKVDKNGDIPYIPKSSQELSSSEDNSVVGDSAKTKKGYRSIRIQTM